jgi:hypothetical protein
MPDIGFKSVGRGRPLAASVSDFKTEVGPNWVRQFRERYDPAHPFPLNGFNRTLCQRTTSRCARDVFTSPDFYADKALWSDPRYFRCNSPQATEYQRGILSQPQLNNGTDAEAPWDTARSVYPREAIVSPYGFKTAQEHYESLLKETQAAAVRTSTRSRISRLPSGTACMSDRTAVAAPPNELVLWGCTTQIPTILSLLKPEYQQRMVQEIYHQMRGNALWPSTFLLARRLHAALVPGGRLGALRDTRRPISCTSKPASRAISSRTSMSAANSTWTTSERRRAAPRRRGASAGTATRSASGQGRADHVDEQHPRLEVALGVRVLEQDAVRRDLHADP